MNEGAPIMYKGGSVFDGPAGMYMMQGQMERHNPRHYHLDMIPMISGVGFRGEGSPRQGMPRWWQPRKERQQQKPDSNAFGYDSDDSSLSSNASGSNKSSEKVERSSGGKRDREPGVVTREWRGRGHRDVRPRRAPFERLTSVYPLQIRFTPEELLNGSQWDALSQQMWDRFVKAQQTDATFRKKMNLWRYLYITIKSIFPRYGLYVVGSTMSGFGLESSDVDLCVHARAAPGLELSGLEPREHALLHLRHILGYIKSFDPDAELIHAKVPILKFRDARNGLQVDLNCNNVVGIRNTNLLHCYSRMDWRVRPLVALAKLWARAHGINDARRRTLSSYALTLMVLNFLQCGASPAVLPRAGDASRRRPPNRCSLGELFLQLLKYYAEFPYEHMAVSVRAARRVPVWECRARAAATPGDDAAHWKLLCVEEPFDLTNTARSVYDPETFEKIVTAFRQSHSRLAAGLRLDDAWPQR